MAYIPVRPERVEGPSFSGSEGKGFDGLSPNGKVEARQFRRNISPQVPELDDSRSFVAS
jgi:hypothetical protein